jgi:hypothetical protein
MLLGANGEEVGEGEVGEAPIVGVARAQGRIVVAEAEFDRRHQRKRRAGAMASDRALRTAGGAGGVHQRPRFARRDRRFRLALARIRQQRLIAPVAGRYALGA